MQACQFLYFERHSLGSPEDRPSHIHSFWQFEYLIAGQFYLNLKDEKIFVKSPSLIFIPPNHLHGFTYLPNNITLFSIKFQLNDMPKDLPVEVHEINEIYAPFCQILENELVAHGSHHPTNIEEILLPLWKKIYEPKSSPTDQKEELHQSIIDYIDTLKGKRISVSEVGKHFSYSTSHISKIFRQQNNDSLKNFIDQKTCEYAMQHLKYSDESIQEIAYQLEFPDVYSFSQFFKRRAAISPMAYRKQET